MDYPLRSCAFGGFNKRDVLSFLDAQSKQFETDKQKLQAELDTAQQELDTLRQERHELGNQLEKVRQELEADGQKRANMSDCLEQMKQERDAVLTLTEQLVQERDELKLRLEAIQPDAQAYAELKERTTWLELGAQYRAKKMQNEAERETQEVRYNVEQWLQRMEQEYTAACSRMKDTVSQATGQLEQMKAELDQFNVLMDGDNDALENMRRIYASAALNHTETHTPIEAECKK